MSDKTNIEWADSTFNPWEGCTKVGPGCDHCYAENRNARFGGGTAHNWGPGAPRRRTSASNWQKPVTWNEKAGRGLFVECSECGLREYRTWDNTLPLGGLSCCSNPECTALPESDSSPARPRVFCASLADWLDNEVPIEWLVDLLDLIRQTPNLDWLLLSKRIGLWSGRLKLAAHGLRNDLSRSCEMEKTLWWLHDWLHGNPPANVWLGATVVNQAEADRDIPKLLEVPARVRFLSCEPLLGPVDLTPWLGGHVGVTGYYVDPKPTWIDWVVAGGESGPGARPMHPDWVRSLRDQCASAGTPFFFKQWGEWGDYTVGHAPKVGWDKIITPNGKVLGAGHAYHGGMVEENWQEQGGAWMTKVGKKAAGRTLDGRTHDEYPAAPA